MFGEFDDDDDVGRRGHRRTGQRLFTGLRPRREFVLLARLQALNKEVAILIRADLEGGTAVERRDLERDAGPATIERIDHLAREDASGLAAGLRLAGQLAGGFIRAFDRKVRGLHPRRALAQPQSLAAGQRQAAQKQQRENPATHRPNPVQAQRTASG
jgi:hypothetical protein